MKRGSGADFEAYVASRWRPLVRVAYLMTGDWNTAEDLVQAALERCLRHWSRVVADGAEDAYVRRTMVNLHINAIRRQRVRELLTFQVPDRAGADDHRRVDDRDQLYRALRRLPARTRTAVVLRHYEGLSEDATATAMSCSVGNVKRLTADGLRTLRGYLRIQMADVRTASDEGGRT
ncbi:SigE family RNA polymerase sigma factor [Paractinoplanes hotanensis]|uniref:SigE family RNA polymerase sigma factor n=1 Tax=Paractinoplanes hotanensis TaxID=2906497 RepID=A0ABT0YFF8_9ACTN|nr:SigE family RNA polymerase sigma factor [Actinoplanes hotanensis]MCM4084257.1 SigE family RNA polymerase sigma factor [Actinoplanes hotanensis]